MKLTLIVLIAACLLTGCSNSDEGITPSEFIKISASIGSLNANQTTQPSTRRNPQYDDFEEGDEMSVYAYEAGDPTKLVVDNGIHSWRNSVWSTQASMKWKDMTTLHDFVAVQPARRIINFTAEPITLGDDLRANDIVVATAKNRSALDVPAVVPLQLEHIMAFLKVVLVFRSEFSSPYNVKEVNTMLKLKGTINFVDKTIEPTGDASLCKIPIEPGTLPQDWVQDFIIVAMPQKIRTINILFDDKTYTYTHESDIELVAGKMQIIQLSVGREKIQGVTSLVNGWYQEDFTGGEATN